MGWLVSKTLLRHSLSQVGCEAGLGGTGLGTREQEGGRWDRQSKHNSLPLYNKSPTANNYYSLTKLLNSISIYA
jgi:hypothetical protein